jgi:tetratricopeptide (TPR) repeat protein
MRRTIAITVLLGVAAAAGAFVYQALSRDQNYRIELARGDAALSDRKAVDAVEAYSGAIALRPDSMLAYLRRGEAYLQRADLELAARDFGKATALDPSAIRALEDLGDVEYRRGRYARALESYESRLRLDDRSADVTFKLALARYRSGDADGALAAVAQTLKLNDRLADAYYLRGLCLRDLGNVPDAIGAFERAVAIAPASIPAREELADAYAAVDRRANQIEQLQALAALDPGQPPRQVAVARAHARAGRWDAAVLTLTSALERAPNEPTIYHALGQVWLERPREKNDRVFLGKALEALQRAATAPGASSTTLLLYGRALLQSGDVDNAERALQDAARRFPVDARALLEYAGLAERQNHLEPARASLIGYDQLVEGDSDRAARAARIGGLSERLNDLPAAVLWLQRASTAAPDDMRILAALAEAQARAGDRDAADATLTRGLETDPTNATLLALARRIRTL